MDYRKATPDDRAALTGLWERVFGDGPEFSALALDVFAGSGNVYVAAKRGGAPQAMLLAVPCTLAGKTGVYFYGLATEPDARGAGVMTGLMRHAEAEKAAAGAQFAVLIPASVALFDYYRKREYRTEIVLRHIVYEAEAGRTAIDEPEERPVEADFLADLREKYLNVPCVGFPAEQMELIAADLREEGNQLSISGEGYAVYLAEGDTLLVPELAAADDASARDLLAALLHTTGCKRAKITLPAGGDLLTGHSQGAVHSKSHPAALLKPLAPDFMVNAPYLRFALDDVADSFVMWNG